MPSCNSGRFSTSAPEKGARDGVRDRASVPGRHERQHKEASLAAVHPFRRRSTARPHVRCLSLASADGWIIVAVHESKESWEQFRDGTLMPKLQEGIARRLHVQAAGAGLRCTTFSCNQLSTSSTTWWARDRLPASSAERSRLSMTKKRARLPDACGVQRPRNTDLTPEKCSGWGSNSFLDQTGTLATIAPVPLRAYTGLTRVPWPTAYACLSKSEPHLPDRGGARRYFAAALATEGLGADQHLASTVALSHTLADSQAAAAAG